MRRALDESRRPVALVTGASGGIGRELSMVLAWEGYDLVLVARDGDRLRVLGDAIARDHGAASLPVRADLADPAGPRAVLAAVEAAGLEVDALVNNAGFASYGPFVDADLATVLDLLQVNVVALTHLTRLVLPGMVARGHGKVLNMASTAAFVPGPLMAVYYASKAYVLSVSQALAEETRGTGVTVTALCPGLTRTGFQTRAAMESSGLMRGGLMEPAAVAEAGYRGMARGQAVVIPGVANRALVQASRLLPRSLLPRLVQRVQAPVER